MREIDYPRNDKYRMDYVEALDLWEKGRHDEVVIAAKYNLTDPTLPRYFQIMNRMLLVSAEHDWAVAESFRLEAERIYREAWSLTKPGEVMESRVLASLRAGLDELKAAHGEDPRLYQETVEDSMGVEDGRSAKRQRREMMIELDADEAVYPEDGDKQTEPIDSDGRLASLKGKLESEE